MDNINYETIYNEWLKASKLIAYSEDINFPNLCAVEQMVQTYIERKRDLIPYFDKDLRIRFNLSESNEPFQWKEILCVLNEWRTRKAEDLFWRKYYNLLYYKRAFEFIEDIFRNDLLLEEIQKGRLLRDIIVNGKRLNSGTKISKYIITLVENPNEERLYGRDYFMFLPVCKYEEKDILIQYLLDMYSQINSSISNREEVLVLSINPVDFILMSENNEGGWSSCHSFWKGKFKTGGLAYALDRESMIAYTYKKKGGDFYDIVEEKLPLKLWRQIIFFDRESRSAIFSKQYPDYMPTYAKYTRKITGHLLAKYFNVKPIWKVFTRKFGDIPLTKEEMKTDKMHIEVNSRNEFLYVDGAREVITMLNDGYLPDKVFVGSDHLYCVNCGDIWYPGEKLTYADSLVCFHCNEDMVVCDYCGEFEYITNSYILHNGLHICHHCYHDVATVCSCCHEIFYNEDIYCVRYIDTYGDTLERYFCKCCKNEIFDTCERCGMLFEHAGKNKKYCKNCYLTVEISQ